MIDISICIPVYNTERYLHRCLDSIEPALLGFTYGTWEIIVVDDGCDDRYTCESIASEYEFTRIIHHESNKGLLEARRTAVAEAKGKYILCLDCDDTLIPDSIYSIYRIAEDYSADIVQCNGDLVFLDKDNVTRRTSRRRFVSPVRQGEILHDTQAFDKFIDCKISTYMCNRLIRRGAYLLAFNDIDPMYCVLNEDYIQTFFLFRHCFTMICVTDKIVNYTIDTGVTNENDMTLNKFNQYCSSVNVFIYLKDYCITHGLSYLVPNYENRIKGNYNRMRNMIKKMPVEWQPAAWDTFNYFFKQ